MPRVNHSPVLLSSIRRPIAYGAGALALTAHTPAQPARDNGILALKARQLLAFESLDDFGRWYFPREVYEQARTQRDSDIKAIAPFYCEGAVIR